MSQHPHNKSKSNTWRRDITDSFFPGKHWLRISADTIQLCQPGYNITQSIQLDDLYQFDVNPTSLQLGHKSQDYDFLLWQPNASLVIERPQQDFKLTATNSLVGNRTVSLRPKPKPVLAGNSNANTLEVFLAYSKSEKDEELFKQFSVHLEVLQRQFQKVYQQQMTFWSINNIIAGQDWMQTIKYHLTTARIILLMVSIDFLNSDFCRKVEMTTVIMRHFNFAARVIPVILRTCPWEKEEFGQLQPLPPNRRPVNKWHDRDEAFSKIYEGIWTSIEELLTHGIQGS